MLEITNILSAAVLGIGGVVLGFWWALRQTAERTPNQLWSRQAVLGPGLVAIAAASTITSLVGVLWAVALGVTTVAAMWDAEYGIIPNALLTPLSLTAVAAVAVQPLSLVVGLVAGGILLLLALAGIGAGDVKLLTLLAPIVFTAAAPLEDIYFAVIFAVFFVALSLFLPLFTVQSGNSSVRLAPGILAATAITPTFVVLAAGG